MSYIRVVLYKTRPNVTGFAYHNFSLHTIGVFPDAFLFALCLNCFHGVSVKRAVIVKNIPTLDGVIFICHNLGSNFERMLTMLYLVSIHEVKNPLGEIVFERGFAMRPDYFLAVCALHGLDNVAVHACTSLEACAHVQNSM